MGARPYDRLLEFETLLDECVCDTDSLKGLGIGKILISENSMVILNTVEGVTYLYSSSMDSDSTRGVLALEHTVDDDDILTTLLLER